MSLDVSASCDSCEQEVELGAAKVLCEGCLGEREEQVGESAELLRALVRREAGAIERAREHLRKYFGDTP